MNRPVIISSCCSNVTTWTVLWLHWRWDSSLTSSSCSLSCPESQSGNLKRDKMLTVLWPLTFMLLTTISISITGNKTVIFASVIISHSVRKKSEWRVNCCRGKDHPWKRKVQGEAAGPHCLTCWEKHMLFRLPESCSKPLEAVAYAQLILVEFER